MTCPLEIEIALWYWVHPSDFGRFTGDNNFDAPRVQQIINAFVQREMLVPNRDNSRDCIYKRGPALDAYVNALMEVPFPIKQWVVPK